MGGLGVVIPGRGGWGGRGGGGEWEVVYRGGVVVGGWGGLGECAIGFGVTGGPGARGPAGTD